MASHEYHIRRQKRALPIAALAVEIIGVFGPGIVMGRQGSRLTRLFGSFQQTDHCNTENIVRSSEHAVTLTECVMQINKDYKEEFFLVCKELKSIHEIENRRKLNIIEIGNSWNNTPRYILHPKVFAKNLKCCTHSSWFL